MSRRTAVLSAISSVTAMTTVVLVALAAPGQAASGGNGGGHGKPSPSTSPTTSPSPDPTPSPDPSPTASPDPSPSPSPSLSPSTVRGCVTADPSFFAFNSGASCSYISAGGRFDYAVRLTTPGYWQVWAANPVTRAVTSGASGAGLGGVGSLTANPGDIVGVSVFICQLMDGRCEAVPGSTGTAFDVP